MKILIIAPAWVGDMVMAQTLFKLLKKQFPLAQIDLVAPPSTAPLAKRMPEIREVFVLKVGHGGLNWRERFALGWRLRSEKYDWAIVLQNSWKSALIPCLAGIPKRTGWRGEFRYGLVNDCRVLDKARYPLMIERFCALAFPKGEALPEIPWPRLSVDKENQKVLAEKFSLDLSKKVLAICPGAEYGPSKRWSPEYFARVAKYYAEKGGQVWLFGGPKDLEIAEKIQALSEGVCINFVGKTSLPDAVDLLAMASIVVTNDSGLMHIAASLEAPMVAIYGSTTPAFTPPLSDRAKILSLKLWCSPCFARTCRFGHYHCLTELLPEKVIEALGN